MDGFQSLRLSHATLATVMLAHVGLVYGLATYRPEATPMALQKVIQISLVQPEKLIEPPPPTSPKPIPPKVVKKQIINPPAKVVELPPVLVARASESPWTVPVVEDLPKPVVIDEPMVVTPVVLAIESPPVDPLPIEPPKFNADYLDNPSPIYPGASRRIGEEGRVLLRVQVGENGLPSKVVLKKPSGYERLDQAALDTVRRWKFVPAQQGGKAVEAWVVVPITFSLKG